MEKIATCQIKVTVHAVPYITRAGHICLKYSSYFVAAGIQPLGPKGGRCGVIVDGEQVSRLFNSRQAAEAEAAAYAASHDAVLNL